MTWHMMQTRLTPKYIPSGSGQKLPQVFITNAFLINIAIFMGKYLHWSRCLGGFSTKKFIRKFIRIVFSL